MTRGANEVSVTKIPTSGMAYVRQVLGQKLDDRARQALEGRASRWEAHPLPPVLSREERDAEIGCGPTTGRVLEATVLPAYLANGHRVTPSDLVIKHIVDQILESFPLDGEPLKAPGAPHLRPQPKPPEPVKAVHERPADAPKRGRPRKTELVAAEAT